MLEHRRPRTCLEVFDAKGFFSLHADDRSRAVFDLAFWLAQESQRGSAGVPIATFSDDVICKVWWADAPNGFGLHGIAPDFVKEWADDRVKADVR